MLPAMGWFNKADKAAASVSSWATVYVLVVGGIGAAGAYLGGISEIFFLFAPWSWLAGGLIAVLLALLVLAVIQLVFGWPPKKKRSRLMTVDMFAAAPQRPARRAPDYAVWDHVQRFTVLQAANLWGERDPGNGMELTAEIRPRYLMIIGAMERGEIRQLGRIVHRLGLQTPVERSELLKYAVDTGQRPKFLYPDAR